MNKKVFLNKLSKGLKPIIPSEKKKYINDYEEIINDMVEGGLSEEEAVEKQGDISKIVENILKDTDKELLAKKDIFSTVVFIVAVNYSQVSGHNL